MKTTNGGSCMDRRFYLFFMLSVILLLGARATQFYEAHGITMSNTQSTSEKNGAEVNITSDFTGYLNITQCPGGTATICYVYANATSVNSARLYAQGTFSGADCLVNGTWNKSSSYMLLADKGGAAYNECYNVATTTPVHGTYLDWLSGLTGSGTSISHIQNDMFQVQGVVLNISTPQNISILSFNATGLSNSSISLDWAINGTSTNLSIYRGTTLVYSTSSGAMNYNDSGLLSNTTYSYVLTVTSIVNAVNASASGTTYQNGLGQTDLLLQSILVQMQTSDDLMVSTLTNIAVQIAVWISWLVFEVIGLDMCHRRRLAPAIVFLVGASIMTIKAVSFLLLPLSAMFSMMFIAANILYSFYTFSRKE